MPSKRIRSSVPSSVTAGGPTTTVDPFTDSYSIGIKAADSSATPTDSDTYAISLAQSDTNAGQAEAVELKFPTGVWGETSATPSEGQSFTVVVWLANSAGSGVTNPSNADGENDGATAQVQTAPLGSNTETLLSDIGTNVGSWTFTSCTYRGWFRLQTQLVTSTARVIARSSTAAFSDITMATLSAVGGDTNHLSGSFTYDLFAAGVDTLSKLQSLQIVHETVDAVAGVTPATVTVDAGNISVGGVF